MAITDDISSHVVSFFFFFLLLHSHLVVSQTPQRETLEIIIGGGGQNGNSAPSPSPYSDYPPPADTPTYCPPPPPPPPPANSRLDRARRVLLKFATTIDDSDGFTKNWKGSNPCNYKGVRCDTYPNSSEKAVAGLDFNGAAFSGKDNSKLGLDEILGIPELTFFHVNSNNFSGSVPSEITKYPYFYELDLSNNKISGEFPSEILDSKLLVFLDLRFNNYKGSLPPKLFQLDLDVIFINNNNFENNLPSNFGSTPARFMTFANNKFTGPIPRSIGNAANSLTEVLFLGNQFSGCLPYEIGYLKKAVVFDVSKNSLTGPIPESFACLRSIRYLNLAHNNFYGRVPESVCRLTGLVNAGNFSVAGNYFTEIGPECVKLVKAKLLDVSQNCIPWLPNQKSPKECHAFLNWVKPCPNVKSLSYVPCKGKMYSTATTAPVAPPPPVTYKALHPSPHRL